MPRRRPAHRAATPRAWWGPRALRAGASALGALVLATALALAGVGASYAFLTDRQTIQLRAGGQTSATITAGTAAISVSTATFSNLYPGATQSSAVTVSNTGVVPLALSVTSITGGTAAGITTTVARGTCGSGTPAVTTGSLGVTVAAGSTTTLCVVVAMPTTAPTTGRGTGTAISVLLDGVQP